MAIRKPTRCDLEPGVRDLLGAVAELLGPPAQLEHEQALRAYDLRPVLGVLVDLGADRSLSQADLAWAAGEIRRRAAARR
jgi:hypothetical protein